MFTQSNCKASYLAIFSTTLVTRGSPDSSKSQTSSNLTCSLLNKGWDGSLFACSLVSTQTSVIVKNLQLFKSVEILSKSLKLLISPANPFAP